MRIHPTSGKPIIAEHEYEERPDNALYHAAAHALTAQSQLSRGALYAISVYPLDPNSQQALDERVLLSDSENARRLSGYIVAYAMSRPGGYNGDPIASLRKAKKYIDEELKRLEAIGPDTDFAAEARKRARL